MAFCGYNETMIAGLNLFAKGLFEAVLAKATASGISLEQAFQEEVAELGELIRAMEERYQALRQETPDESLGRPKVMNKLAEWVGEHDRSQ